MRTFLSDDKNLSLEIFVLFLFVFAIVLLLLFVFFLFSLMNYSPFYLLELVFHPFSIETSDFTCCTLILCVWYLYICCRWFHLHPFGSIYMKPICLSIVLNPFTYCTYSMFYIIDNKPVCCSYIYRYAIDMIF